MDKRIMIGTWAWGTGNNGSRMVFGNKQDPKVLASSFKEAVKAGFLKWDTAAVYGMGTCETLLGKLIKKHDDVFISTKYFPGKRFKSGELTKSLNASLSRLGRDHADLFWLHVPNNLEKNLEEAIPHIRSGKIKMIGVSNVSLDHIKQAEAYLEKRGLKLGAVQNHFSILRNNQQKIIDYCNSKGIEYYAYMVLEQGALSGNYSAKKHFPTISMRNILFPKCKFKKIEGLLGKMNEIAVKLNVDRSQIPILWVMSKGAIPIVGITKPSHAEKLAAAAEVTLSDLDVAVLEAEASKAGLCQIGSWEPQ